MTERPEHEACRGYAYGEREAIDEAMQRRWGWIERHLKLNQATWEAWLATYAGAASGILEFQPGGYAIYGLPVRLDAGLPDFEWRFVDGNEP